MDPLNPNINFDIKAAEATYDATASDKIRINDDKLWRYLKDYEKPIKLIAYLSSTFTIGLSFLVTLLSSDFKPSQKSFILDAPTWRVLFVSGFVISAIIFICNLFKIVFLIVRKKWMTTEALIKKIKKEARKDA